MNMKQKPSGIWFVEFEDEAGKRRRVSTGIKTVKQRVAPADAKAKAREIVLGLDQQSRAVQPAHKKAGHITMRELFDKALGTVWAPSEAKSQGTILSNVRILNALEVRTHDRVWIFGDEPANNITFSALEDVVAALKTRGYAPATIKRKLDMVSKALRMGTKWTGPDGRSLVDTKPVMPSIRVANLKDRVIHGAADASLLGVPDEEKLIFEAIERRRVAEPNRPWFRVAALLRFLMDVGGRLGESLATGPNGKDIGFRPVLLEDGTVIQRPVVIFPRFGTKNDKPRMVPLTDAAWAALESQKPFAGEVKIKNLDEVYTKLVYFPLKASHVWYMFDQIKADMKEKDGVDISDVTIHTFRHTCLSRLAQGGMDLLHLQQWAGHSDPKITADRYAHLMPSNLMSGLLMLGSTGGAIPKENGTKPVNVPNTLAGVNRANLGTGVPH